MITPSLPPKLNICKTHCTVKWQLILSVFLWLYGTFRCLWFDYNFSASSLTPLQSIDLQKRSLYQFSQNGQIMLTKTVPELYTDTHTIFCLFVCVPTNAFCWFMRGNIRSLEYFSQPTFILKVRHLFNKESLIFIHSSTIRANMFLSAQHKGDMLLVCNRSIITL